jgi:poly-gamma-glutamate synthesis protein (capsule biosynthesis protein)
VITCFTFTRGADGRFAVTLAEAIPTRIQRSADGVTVMPTEPDSRSFNRVAKVLGQRHGVDAGLIIRPP